MHDSASHLMNGASKHASSVLPSVLLGDLPSQRPKFNALVSQCPEDDHRGRLVGECSGDCSGVFGCGWRTDCRGCAAWSALTSADAPVCQRFIAVRVVELDSIRGIVDHNTSQMLRTIGLLPSCAGLRGSTVSFSGVHCLGGSLQV